MKTLKNIGFIALLLFITSGAFAQMPKTIGTMKFFSEEGEKFTLYINGEIQNDPPLTSITAEEVIEPSVQVRIVFVDPAIAPISRKVMRMGNDCVYMISKDKKGQYNFKIKSATGNMGGAPPQPVSAPAPVTGPAPTSSGPLSATYEDGYITLSDGTYYTVTRSGTTGGWPSPHVIMNAPKGAKVVITYDNTSEKYNTEVPFDYEVQDYNNNNSYFKLSVDEGNGRTWYVRMQNGTGYVLKIE